MLDIDALTIVYPDGTKAVDRLCCRIGKGETVGLIGANGAGKTSLLLSLVGVLKASGGAIRVDGVELGPRTVDDIRRRVGLVFQNPDDQLFMPGIYEDVAFGPRNLGLPEDAVRERVERVLGQLGIGDLRHRSPLKLSGGQKRTAAIATVLAMDPSLMLFDEPTAFLDPRSRRTLIGLLKALPQAKLIAAHDLPFIAELYDRVIVMKDGAVFADGAADLLRDAALMESCDMEALGS